MIRVGIYGATGYTGFELIRLLNKHAQAEIVFATARSAAGQRLSDIFPTLIDQPLVSAEQINPADADVIFCCLPHGTTAPYVRAALDAGARVIDLSNDFRLRDPANYQRWFKHEHSAPDLQTEAVYGMPELYREAIQSTRLVANPGCYPTSIILALHPLIKAGLLADQNVIADSKSGVSGAGRSFSLKTHFSESHENFSAYSIGRSHRHLAEMEQETGLRIIFSPHLLPVVRGILSTIYVRVPPQTPLSVLREAFMAHYANEPFVKLLPEGKLPELRYVVNTNMCVIGMQYADADSGQLILVSAEDNLLKGASGQAVQNMNIMFGVEEATGLL